VVWADTPNGHGVTEGGSSGAPIFNNEGYILGGLTGGLAACEPGGGGPGTGPDKPDYYGSIYYSWDQNGNNSDERLDIWLDPDNTGIEKLRGINSVLTADFDADATSILAGSDVLFTNNSSGAPDIYEWYFEGGNPSVSFDINPPPISYAEGGEYDVTLIVSRGTNSDTLIRKDYIQVVGKVYPNPATHYTTLYIGEELIGNANVEVVDISGRLMYENKINSTDGFNQIRLDLTGFSSGMYVVRITANQRFQMQKLMVIR
jgi:hypothetical protein